MKRRIASMVGWFAYAVIVASLMGTAYGAGIVAGIVVLGAEKPEAVTEIEKVRAENLALKITVADKEVKILEQQWLVVQQQLVTLRQEQAAHNAAVLRAHKAPEGSSIDWPNGVIQPPAPKPEQAEPAKKDGP